MSKIEELRTEFEVFLNKSNSTLAYIAVMCEFNNKTNDYIGSDIHDYSLGSLNGAWFMFQELNK